MCGPAVLGTMGKIGNCQVAVSVHAVTDKASAPLDWRLFMPKSWDDEAADSPEAAAAVQTRREACKIPAGEHHRPKWQMAIEMLDELAEWGYRPPVVAADAGYGDTTAFRLALEERNIGYLVAGKGSTSAYTADAVPVTAVYTGRGRPPVPRYPRHPPAVRTSSWPQGEPPARSSPGAEGPGAVRATSQRRCGPTSSRSGSVRPTRTSTEPTTEPCPKSG